MRDALFDSSIASKNIPKFSTAPCFISSFESWSNYSRTLSNSLYANYGPKILAKTWILQANGFFTLKEINLLYYLIFMIDEFIE